MQKRRGAAYWGPALVVIGAITVIAAFAIFDGTVLYWAVVAGITAAITGCVLVAHQRL